MLNKLKRRPQSLLLLIIGVLAIILAFRCYGMSTGSSVRNQSYGGDAYTGIQNAAARTANNLQDLMSIERFGFGSLLLIAGLTLCATGVFPLFAKEDATLPEAKFAAEPQPAAPASETKFTYAPAQAATTGEDKPSPTAE